MILENLVLVIPRSVNSLELQVPLGGLDEHLRLNGPADLPCDDINSIPGGLSLEQVENAVKGCLQRVRYLAGHRHASLASPTMRLRQTDHALDVGEASVLAAHITGQLFRDR